MTAVNGSLEAVTIYVHLLELMGKLSCHQCFDEVRQLMQRGCFEPDYLGAAQSFLDHLQEIEQRNEQEYQKPRPGRAEIDQKIRECRSKVLHELDKAIRRLVQSNYLYVGEPLKDDVVTHLRQIREIAAFLPDKGGQE